MNIVPKVMNVVVNGSSMKMPVTYLPNNVSRWSLLGYGRSPITSNFMVAK